MEWCLQYYTSSRQWFFLVKELPKKFVDYILILLKVAGTVSFHVGKKFSTCWWRAWAKSWIVKNNFIESVECLLYSKYGCLSVVRVLIFRSLKRLMTIYRCCSTGRRPMRILDTRNLWTPYLVMLITRYLINIV